MALPNQSISSIILITKILDLFAETLASEKFLTIFPRNSGNVLVKLRNKLNSQAAYV